MKQIIIFSLLIAVAFTTQAQVKVMYGSNGLARDSVSDTGTETWTSGAVAKSKTIGVIFAVTKISGTVAGAAVLQGSADGTIFSTIASSSQSPSNGSVNYNWELTDPKWAYYRISWTGAGTMAASATAKLIAR